MNKCTMREAEIRKYSNTKASAIQMVEETAGRVNQANVKVSYRVTAGFFGGVEVTVKSPHLTYHKAVYAPGGDSILLRRDAVDEIEYVYRTGGGEDPMFYDEIRSLYEFMELADRLSQGETIEIVEPLSQNAAQSMVRF